MLNRKSELIASKLDVENILKDARNELKTPARRLFGKRLLSLGGLMMLSGCNISDDKSVNTVLRTMSRFNDEAQAWLFDPNRLAPTYPESMITRPFPFNAYYEIERVPSVDASGFRLLVGGRVRQPGSWTLEQLASLPHQEQITRHICVEGWSAIGRWGGVPFTHFLNRVGADLSSKYVGFKCADDYY